MSKRVWYAALIALYLSWGSTYFAMRIALRDMPPFLMLSARCAIAGAILYAIAVAHGARRPQRENWRAALRVGIYFMGFGQGWVTWGVQYVDSGIAALLVSVTPLWMMVLAWKYLDERPSLRSISGLVAGAGGVALVVLGAHNGPTRTLGLAALLVAPVGWGVGAIKTRTAGLPADPLMSAAVQLLVASPFFAAAGVVSGELGRVAVTQDSLVAFGYLVIVGYVVGFSAFTYLLKVGPMSKVSTYAYVNPLVALVLGVVFLNEVITTWVWIGGAVIVVSVAFIVSEGARLRLSYRRTPVDANA